MTSRDWRQQEAVYFFKWLAATAAVLGLAAGVQAAMGAVSLEGAVARTGAPFDVLIVAFVVQWWVLVTSHRDPWAAQARTAAAHAYGTLFGIAIVCSLVAALCFLAFAIVVPHLFAPFETDGLTSALRHEVFTLRRLLLLAGASVTSALGALAWLSRRSGP